MNDFLLFADWKQWLIGPLMGFTAIFLILVVLVQRGRGGGLTGALGGAGGQSAFGAKAGDVFTRITVVVASFWILLCILAVLVLQDAGRTKLEGGPGDTRRAPGAFDMGAPATDTPAGAETDLQLDADTPAIEAPPADGPALDGPALDGPALDGPALDGAADDTAAPIDDPQ